MTTPDQTADRLRQVKDKPMSEVYNVDRHQLIDLIEENATISDDSIGNADEIADRIIAAGWIPATQAAAPWITRVAELESQQPRIIDNAEDLDALPEGAAVLELEDEQRIWQVDSVDQVGDYRKAWWASFGSAKFQSSAVISLPVQVISIPDGEADAEEQTR